MFRFGIIMVRFGTIMLRFGIIMLPFCKTIVNMGKLCSGSGWVGSEPIGPNRNVYFVFRVR